MYSPIYPPQSGGAASYFSNLVNNIEQDHEAVVITTKVKNAEGLFHNGQPGIYRIIPRLHRLPLFLRTAIPSIIAFIVGMYFIIFKDIDVVHSHSTANAVPGLAIATTLTRTPLIFDCRDADFPLWMITLGNSVHWFSCSSNIDQRLRRAGVPADKITRIPVVNPDYITKYATKERKDEFTVIFVGTIARFKGINLLLDGFEILQSRHDDVNLVIVGNGPDINDVREQIQTSPSSDSIHLQGQMSHSEALTEISKSDVLVLPSEREGLPRVIVEAFELGTPVISTPVGGVPELIEDGETGLLVEREPENIADALDKLYSSQELRERLSKNAFKQTEDWNWETVKTRVNKVYCDVSR